MLDLLTLGYSAAEQTGITGRLFGSVSPAPVVTVTQLRNVLATAPAGELAELRRLFLVAYGSQMPADLTRAAKMLSGGDDGKFTSLAGKDLKAYIGQLVAAYGSGAAASSGYGSVTAQYQPISGGVSYDGDGFSGGVSFGNAPAAATPVWMKVGFFVLILVAVWAVATGLGGKTTGGLS